MKKYFLFILLTIFIVSCFQDPNQRKISNSFSQFLDSINVEDLQKENTLVPFLSGLSVEDRNTILKPFYELNKKKYKLEISKKSSDLYYLKIRTNNSDSIWTNIILPYHKNNEGQWVMSPIIKSVRTFDIIPAKK